MSIPFHLYEEFSLGPTIYSDILYWQNPGSGCDSCKPGYINVKDNVILSNSLLDLTNLRSNLSLFSRTETITSFSSNPIQLISSVDDTLCIRDKASVEFYIDEASFVLSEIPNVFASMNRQILISNCEKYSLYPSSLTPICSECESGYIPNINHQQCHLASFNLSNCLVALSSSKCALCDGNYSLTSTKTCSSLNISNCIEYAYLNTTYNSSNTTLRCIRCENGYFSEDGISCQKIMIEGCLIAFNADTCIECSSGKYLFENGFITECRDVGSRVNCSKAYFDVKEDNMYCLDCVAGDHILKKLDYTQNTGKFLLLI